MHFVDSSVSKKLLDGYLHTQLASLILRLRRFGVDGESDATEKPTRGH